MRRQRPGTGGYAGFDLDRPDGVPFAVLVGKLLVNCGGIELLSLLWIRELADSQVIFDLAVEFPLARRIDLVLDLAERRELPSNLWARTRRAWQEARSIAEVRNVVAHSPLAFGWHGPERPGQPDFLGIPVLRDLKRNTTGKIRIGKIEGLAKAVDGSVTVASDLSNLLDQVVRVVDKSSKPAGGST